MQFTWENIQQPSNIPLPWRWNTLIQSIAFQKQISWRIYCSNEPQTITVITYVNYYFNIFILGYVILFVEINMGLLQVNSWCMFQCFYCYWCLLIKWLFKHILSTHFYTLWNHMVLNVYFFLPIEIWTQLSWQRRWPKRRRLKRRRPWDSRCTLRSALRSGQPQHRSTSVRTCVDWLPVTGVGLCLL